MLLRRVRLDQLISGDPAVCGRGLECFWDEVEHSLEGNMPSSGAGHVSEWSRLLGSRQIEEHVSISLKSWPCRSPLQMAARRECRPGVDGLSEHPREAGSLWVRSLWVRNQWFRSASHWVTGGATALKSSCRSSVYGRGRGRCSRPHSSREGDRL